MFVSHRAVMRTEQPSLQERHDLMDVWHQLRRRPGVALKERDPALVALAPQRLVPKPSVGVHQTPRLDGVLHERHQGLAGGVWNAAQSDATESSLLDLHGNCHK